MRRIGEIISDPESNVRVYLLKRLGRTENYEAVVFPNSLDRKIKQTYAENYVHFCGEREIKEYDSVHSEKGTIKRLPVTDLLYWNGIQAAMTAADTKRILLNKANFTDDYSVIVLVYERKVSGGIDRAYLIAQYRKVESWYKRSVRFGFTANSILQETGDIFVLNGCIDTAIVGSDVFVLQETPFEKIFNYYEKSKRTVAAHKSEIEKWIFLDHPESFYLDASQKKGTTVKLARALDKATSDFSKLDPAKVRGILSQHEEFNDFTYDENDKIIYTPKVKDLIIDIVRKTYVRDLLTDDLVHTKGI